MEQTLPPAEDALTKNWSDIKISYIVCLKSYGYNKQELLLDDEEEEWFWALFAFGKKRLRRVFGTTRCRGPNGWVYTLERVGMKTYIANLSREDETN